MEDPLPFPKRLRHSAWILALALYVGFSAAIAQSEHNPAYPARSDHAVDSARVIVKFRRDSEIVRRHTLSAASSETETRAKVSARASMLGARLGMTLGAGRSIGTHTQVITTSGLHGLALSERLAAETDVEYAVVDQRRRHFMLPNDPLYAQGPAVDSGAGGPLAGQWYLRAPSGDIAASINASSAWDQTTGSSSIVVAILDTGVRGEHPDLAGRLLAGYDMISAAATANDKDGRDADASDPGDWVTIAESYNRRSLFYGCGAEDSSWHGTMTTSLIGATANNSAGMAGVAWGVKLLPVRVLGKCGGYDSDIIAGMQWAAGLSVPGVPANPNPARVINMSLGASGTCPSSYLDAISSISSQPNPAVIVAAAGNSNGQAVGSPANCPGVIAVAGLRHLGTKVGFSDLGPEISISAPAGNCVNTTSGLPCLYPILAATNTGATIPAASSYTDAFNASVGTSFSAPLVAGTVALMLSARPSLTLDEIRSVLKNAARAFPFRGAPDDPTTGPIQDCRAPGNVEQTQCYCTTSTCGAGMLDAASAVAGALGLQPHISVIPGTLYPGTTVTLSSAGTLLGNGRGIASEQWSIVDGGGTVSTFSSGANAALAILTPSRTGRLSVRLTITDDAGLTASAESVLTVVPGVGVVTTATTSATTATAPTTTTSSTTTSTAPVPTTTSTTSTTSSTPVSTTTISGVTTTTLAGTSATLNFVAGWNLVGNSSSNALDVATAFADGSRIATVWKWIAGAARWAFYAPSLIGQTLPDYALSKNYDVLSTIDGGEGFWVNAKQSTSVALPRGTPVTIAALSPILIQGWNLSSIGETATPKQFCDAQSTGVTTLWAWDSTNSAWYFYAPSLDASNALAGYITGKGYLDFTTAGKTLGPGVGFWVNKP